MASHADISATSYMINVGNQSKITCYFTEDKVSQITNLEKKFFCTIFINKLRCIACVDNGSDLTIMHYTLFKDIFSSVHQKVLKPSVLK